MHILTHTPQTWFDLMSAGKLSELGSGEFLMLLDSDEKGEEPMPEIERKQQLS